MDRRLEPEEGVHRSQVYKREAAVLENRHQDVAARPPYTGAVPPSPQDQKAAPLVQAPYFLIAAQGHHIHRRCFTDSSRRRQRQTQPRERAKPQNQPHHEPQRQERRVHAGYVYAPSALGAVGAPLRDSRVEVYDADRDRYLGASRGWWSGRYQRSEALAATRSWTSKQAGVVVVARFLVGKFHRRTCSVTSECWLPSGCPRRPF